MPGYEAKEEEASKKEAKPGDIEDVTFDGKVKKELIELGDISSDMPLRNYMIKMKYRGFLIDKASKKEQVFDDEYWESEAEMILGDMRYPEGLWKGLEKMHKNEHAKIMIKKGNYSFGRKANSEKFRFGNQPEYQGEDSAERKKLLSSTVIFEVKLLDWVEREDIDGEGHMIKTFIRKGPLLNFTKPKDIDDITATIWLKSIHDDKLLL